MWHRQVWRTQCVARGPALSRHEPLAHQNKMKLDALQPALSLSKGLAAFARRGSFDKAKSNGLLPPCPEPPRILGTNSPAGSIPPQR